MQSSNFTLLKMKHFRSLLNAVLIIVIIIIANTVHINIIHSSTDLSCHSNNNSTIRMVEGQSESVLGQATQLTLVLLVYTTYSTLL